MRIKYIEERLGGRWFIFGESSGHADIANADNDTLFEKLPKGIAERMITEQDTFIEKLYELLREV